MFQSDLLATICAIAITTVFTDFLLHWFVPSYTFLAFICAVFLELIYALDSESDDHEPTKLSLTRELGESKQTVIELQQQLEEAQKTIKSLNEKQNDTMIDWLGLYRHAKANDWIAENMPEYQLGPQ